MVKTSVYNISGKIISDTALPAQIFGIKPNTDLIYQAIKVQHANARYATAQTKTRGEIAGSGIKPWRQKGTGRARVGDIRTPTWRGGGTVFGPRNDRNYSMRLPKKMRRQAIFMALSDKVKNKKLIVLDKLILKEIKTRQAEKLLQNMPIKTGTILIIISKTDPAVELSFQNLPYVKILKVNSLSVYDILKYKWLIIDKETLEKLEEIFFGKKQIAKVKKIQKPQSKSARGDRSLAEKVKTKIKSQRSSK